MAELEFTSLAIVGARYLMASVVAVPRQSTLPASVGGLLARIFSFTLLSTQIGGVRILLTALGILAVLIFIVYTAVKASKR
jgi:hypothetical protein